MRYVHCVEKRMYKGKGREPAWVHITRFISLIIQIIVKTLR